ncbi:hypothetical protein KW785_02185 [Candidatus Parcubacteria bacterium]|nr:hypothetical protein [Candidatus Parcubacteria bacterium]
MANNNSQKVLVGAGLAAVAAGAYFFLGPNGKKHQKKMKGWMVKMKGEVLERLEDAREMTEPVYNEIIDGVAQTYSVANKVPKSEIVALATDLKRHWKNIVGGRKTARKTTRTKKNSRSKK